MVDTSVLIARETGRPIDLTQVPQHWSVCVVSVAELHLGVLATTDVETRTRRLATFEFAAALDPILIDVPAAQRWATLRIRLREEGRRAKINDLWIAAVAQANGLPIVTQDDDFDAIEAVGGPEVIRV